MWSFFSMLVWNRAKHLLLWFLGIFAWGILACIERDCFSIERRAVVIGLEMSPDGHQYSTSSHHPSKVYSGPIALRWSMDEFILTDSIGSIHEISHGECWCCHDDPISNSPTPSSWSLQTPSYRVVVCAWLVVVPVVTTSAAKTCHRSSPSTATP